MKTGALIRSLMRPVSPFDEELERLADLKANGCMTARDYRDAKREVETARAKAGVR